jgi:hypothetical protein
MTNNNNSHAEDVKAPMVRHARLTEDQIVADLRCSHEQQKAAARARREKAVQLPAADRFVPRADSQARWGRRSLSMSRCLSCFDRCVVAETARQRNSFTRRIRLLRARTALGLKDITSQDIAARVLEVQAHQSGEVFHALTATDRLTLPRPEVKWLIPGLLPENDFTIIGGRPKVGKTWLAVDMGRSILTGSDFMNFGASAIPYPVILVTDDQADGDSAEMLSATGIWNNPLLLWSRHFRLNEQNLAGLLRTIQDNPGAVVILDSLRSISRHLKHGENDPEIGAMLYDLKQVVLAAGGTLIAIHHCNKGEEQIGTEALSGHNAIAGAANTILTLHYVTAGGRPIKDTPRRRLVREARSGQGFDLVISRTPDGHSFCNEGPYSAWQERAEAAAQQETAKGRLTARQEAVLTVIKSAPDRWWTCRDVVNVRGIDWEGSRNNETRWVRDALNRLVELNYAETQRTENERTWKYTPDRCLANPVHPVKPSHGNAFDFTTGNGEPRELPAAGDVHGVHETVRERRSTALQDVHRLHGVHNPTEAGCASGDRAHEATFAAGQVVEHLGDDGHWTSGWRVAVLETTSRGDQRARIESTETPGAARNTLVTRLRPSGQG